ncbi:conserved hypothetical protein [Ricinus communis]|uniref:Uncharacterized protein n=1 Tax=Ricinus communis TaxID=3988 RepID=B9SU14_RICCO|nr:conserved hypothetical protein [Ricinus communis]
MHSRKKKRLWGRLAGIQEGLARDSSHRVVVLETRLRKELDLVLKQEEEEEDIYSRS